MKKAAYEVPKFEEPTIETYTDNEIMTMVVCDSSACAACGFCVF